MHRKHLAVGSMAVAGVLLLGACGSATTGASDSAPVSKTVNGKGRTLTLWDYETPTSAMGIAWNQAIKIFEKQTGATVKFEAKSFEQIRSTSSQVLNSSSAPDVMEYNKGNATAGLLSSQGLLTNLDVAVKTYGWDKELAPSLQTTAKYNAKGIMGSGAWYGVPTYGEYVMVYYNKTMFAKQHIAVPTTLAGFVSAMQQFKNAGITPLAESAVEYPLGQLWYQLLLSKASRAFVNNYQTYTGPVNWQGPEISYATSTIKDWVNKGYISTDVTGEKAQDAATNFLSGANPIFYSGSWWYNQFTTQAKFQWGSFLFPQTTMSPGSSGNIWVVPENAKNKDLAYKFIDITMSPAIQALMGNSGGVPVAAKTSAITVASSKTLINNFNILTKRDGIGFYPDWPTPTFYDQLDAGLQELVNGTKSVKAVDAELGTEYQTGVNSIVKAP
jgi:raffinose/stachyose/melibiose transport system substrate-binding protein